MPCRIETGLRLSLFVGCHEDERRVEQWVGVKLRVVSAHGFRAALTDELSDTLDVERLKFSVAEAARHTRVRTLERLGALLETELRKGFPEPGLGWEIQLTKEQMGWTYVQAWET